MKISDYKTELEIRNQFKVGDKVFHILHGWGTIIEDDINHKIRVLFEQEDDGYISLSNLKEYVECQLLSFTEYELEGLSQNRLLYIRNEKIKDLGI